MPSIICSQNNQVKTRQNRREKRRRGASVVGDQQAATLASACAAKRSRVKFKERIHASSEIKHLNLSCRSSITPTTTTITTTPPQRRLQSVPATTHENDLVPVWVSVEAVTRSVVQGRRLRPGVRRRSVVGAMIAVFETTDRNYNAAHPHYLTESRSI